MPKQKTDRRVTQKAQPSARAKQNGAAPKLDVLPEILDGGEGELLGDVARFISTYVAMSPAQLLAVSLWVFHTHVVHFAEQTPYLLITSPEKQCGKTRFMEVLELLVPRPWQVISPSEAVIYRTVNSSMPTLLLDEVDTIFKPQNAKDNEHLRALINAGNRPGVTVPRCVGNTPKVQDFNVYCAKALAGIGTLPDTITDRSLSIRLKRRKKTESVERFRRSKTEPAGHALRDRLGAWGKKNGRALKRARPKVPDQLSDRMQDACEQLFAIADRMGEPWSEKLSRDAVVELCTGERADSQESIRLRLLRDIRDIFEERDRKAGKRGPSIQTATLLSALSLIEEAPWLHYYGRGLGDRDLAALLKGYGIGSATIRFKKVGPKKGYKRDAFHEAWLRYLS